MRLKIQNRNNQICVILFLKTKFDETKLHHFDAFSVYFRLFICNNVFISPLFILISFDLKAYCIFKFVDKICVKMMSFHLNIDKKNLLSNECFL